MENNKENDNILESKSYNEDLNSKHNIDSQDLFTGHNADALKILKTHSELRRSGVKYHTKPIYKPHKLDAITKMCVTEKSVQKTDMNIITLIFPKQYTKHDVRFVLANSYKLEIETGDIKVINLGKKIKKYSKKKNKEVKVGNYKKFMVRLSKDVNFNNDQARKILFKETMEE